MLQHYRVLNIILDAGRVQQNMLLHYILGNIVARPYQLEPGSRLKGRISQQLLLRSLVELYTETLNQPSAPLTIRLLKKIVNILSKSIVKCINMLNSPYGLESMLLMLEQQQYKSKKRSFFVCASGGLY